MSLWHCHIWTSHLVLGVLQFMSPSYNHIQTSHLVLGVLQFMSPSHNHIRSPPGSFESIVIYDSMKLLCNQYFYQIGASEVVLWILYCMSVWRHPITACLVVFWALNFLSLWDYHIRSCHIVLSMLHDSITLSYTILWDSFVSIEFYVYEIILYEPVR